MIKNPCSKKLLKVPMFLFAMLLVIFILPISPAQAEDPAGCFSNGVTLSITAYRADGITPIGGGSVESAETILYGATLSHAGGSNCNFEGGILTITTPDGVAHIVASGAGIPLVSSGSPFIAPQQAYVVSETDTIAGLLSANVNYSGGTSDTPVIPQNAQAQVDISSPYQDVSLTVEKTAKPASVRTYDWTIEKTVTPATWHLFDGESGTSKYTISLDKSVIDETHSVEGSITIYNPAQFADASITHVSDSISGVGAISVDCPESLPYLLGPGENLVCSYSGALPDNSTRTNTATVNTDGDINGNSDDASIDFSAVTPSSTGGSVTVDDTFAAGDAGPFSDSTEYSYERSFNCADDEGLHENTATIVETGAQDSASVSVNCYEIEIEKTAETSFDRGYTWTLNKTANSANVSLLSGETYDILYTVTASVEDAKDTNWMVSGDITVTNPAPIAATLNTIEDSLSGLGNVSVDCSVVFPYTLGAGDELVCTYETSLPNGTTRTNTATVKRQNYSYAFDGTATQLGTSQHSGAAAVTFSTPVETLDESVTITDSYAGDLGSVTVSESPKSFTYTRTVSFTDEECGVHSFDNTATLTTDDTDTSVSDEQTVLISVICPQGCTNSFIYWLNRTELWPAQSLMLGNHTYSMSELLMILDPPRSRYHNLTTLAQQLISAKLNVLMGADDSKIAESIEAADMLIGDQVIPPIGHGYVSVLKTLPLASTLSKYNSGITGPGSCNCLCFEDDLGAQSCSL